MIPQSEINDLLLYIESGITESYADTPCNFLTTKKNIFDENRVEQTKTKTENVSTLNARAEAEKSLRSVNTISELQTQIKNFTLNPLSKFAANAICGIGVENPTLLVITDTPNTEEEKTGTPLCGTTGELLQRILTAIHSSIQTNTFTFPASPFRAPGGRPPTTEEMEITKPFINKFIEILKPKFILTMGGIPFTTLTNISAPITTIRGKWHEINNIKIMPTFSLQQIDTNKEARRKAWEDLKILLSEME